jgi:hypothetical protein
LPFYNRVYTRGQLQFITASTYRRTQLFLSERFRRRFVQTLEEVRLELRWLARSESSSATHVSR